jgi:MFS transporter, OFA family, oxalate/formate antiporter
MEPGVSSKGVNTARGGRMHDRRLQLGLAVLAMIFIAPLQYSWTLFTDPLVSTTGWSLAHVQIAFTCFVVAQTVTQPLGGYWMDRRGPRLAYSLAALCILVGWGGLGWVQTLPILYLLYGIAGIGAGIVYAGAIGIGIRWFPDRRGLALGLVTAGFGAGAAPFIPIVQRLIDGRGIEAAFVMTGVTSALVVLVIGQVLRNPKTSVEAVRAGAGRTPHAAEAPRPLGLLRMGTFWMAFFAFLFMATGLLILTANTKPLGESLGIASTIIVAAVTLQQILNGASRVVWGWVSDRVGRETTMAIAFAINALLLFLIPVFGDSSIGFIALTSLALFTSGEIFALFPALTGDRFGSKYASANQGMLYTAKGIASLGGGAFAAWLAVTYSWTVVFGLASSLALAASIIMLVMRAQARTAAPAVEPEAVVRSEAVEL